MDFTGRKRLEYALNFKEADRVPIELWVPENLMDYPKAQKLINMVDEYCDTFKGIDIIDRGFFGTPAKLSSKLVGEDSVYTYTENSYSVENGNFSQIIQRDKLNVQYTHYKKQFFSSIGDLQRFESCSFPEFNIPGDYGSVLNAECADRHMPLVHIIHPFGMLARNSPPDEFYIWLIDKNKLIHRLLEKMYNQIFNYIQKINMPVVYYICALEMAIEPWLGRNMFDEYIYQYDVVMNKKIHDVGGIVRHHSHGPVFKHLEHWADMGIDSLEPMEMAPFGDTILGEAKKLMGNRMSFGGNIPSQKFTEISEYEIDKLVSDAVESCAAGGGFILKGASSVCGLNSFKTLEQLDRIIESTEHFITSGIKYGKY